MVVDDVPEGVWLIAKGMNDMKSSFSKTFALNVHRSVKPVVVDSSPQRIYVIYIISLTFNTIIYKLNWVLSHPPKFIFNIPSFSK